MGKKNFLRNIFHCWTIPVLLRGIKKGFENENVNLPRGEQSVALGGMLSSYWIQEVAKAKPCLMRTILQMFGSEFLKSSLLLLFQQIVLRVSLPILMGLLISFLEGGSRVSRDGYILVSLFIFAAFFSSLIFHVGIFQLQRTGMRIRVALTNFLYTKVLRLSGKSLSSTGVGELTNLLSNDLNRFDDCLEYLPFVLIGPLQVLVVIGVLCVYTGPACFPGLAILLLLLPIQGFLGRAFGKLRMEVAEITDRRVRQVTELLHGILLIKMSAWEKNFEERVIKIRSEELCRIQKNNFLSGLNLSLFEISTRLSVLFTLFTFVMTSNHGLTTETVFVTLCMYNTMSLSVGAFLPNGVSGLSELFVSIKRIQRILLLTEKSNMRDSIETLACISTPSSALQIQNLYCSWGNEKETLRNINFSAKAGDVLGIVGPVGSGKSSLLSGILGELLAENSNSVIVNGSLAYASQEPWLFPGSIKENIILGLPLDEVWYEEVLEACALKKDLQGFVYGDETLVGDEGMMLSGGQKTRINLARAVYARADIYLLDDTLSSLDVRVARHVVEKCIGGLLREKCVILVTHGKSHLEGVATEILSMENGSIVCRGSCVDVFGTSEAESENREDGVGDLTMDDMKVDEGESEVKQFKSLIEIMEVEMKPKAEEELRRSGSVGWKLFFTYIRAGNPSFGLLLLLILIIMTQVVINGSDLWLKNWTEKERHFRKTATIESTAQLGTLPRHVEFALWYAGLVGFVFICCFARVQGIFCALLTAGKTLHANLFGAILKAPMSFFEQNPPGLLLKLFSNDVGVIDERLPNLFFRVIGTLLQVVGSFVVVCLMERLLLIPTAIFLIIAFFIQKTYILASSELKRLEGVARSPILGHLKTTVGGLPTIRALKAEKHFYLEFTKKQDAQSSIFLLYLASFRWLTLTLELLTNTYIGVVMILLVVTAVDGSTFGLALTAALSILNEGTGVVMFSARCINHVLSVERILDYSDVEPEESPEKPMTQNTVVDWPRSGEISFSDVCLSYKNGPNVLEDINLHILNGEKIGVIGRTGAGKSSLVASLFRIIEPQMGEIEIDGVNTKELRLKILRLKLSIIPQNPILLAGTLRRNLDPFSEFLDKEIWEVIEVVQLKRRMIDEGAGLDFEISEGGVNLSQGERQLISLARTLLRKNKIIVLDEATANIDTETDAIIQTALRERLTEATVITIAHRLQTIIDADRILVLDGGKVKEFDKPTLLLQNEESFFYKLLQQAGKGHTEKLLQLAEKAQTTKMNCDKTSPEEDLTITRL